MPRACVRAPSRAWSGRVTGSVAALSPASEPLRARERERTGYTHTQTKETLTRSPPEYLKLLLHKARPSAPHPAMRASSRSTSAKRGALLSESAAAGNSRPLPTAGAECAAAPEPSAKRTRRTAEAAAAAASSAAAAADAGPENASAASGGKPEDAAAGGAMGVVPVPQARDLRYYEGRAKRAVRGRASNPRAAPRLRCARPAASLAVAGSRARRWPTRRSPSTTRPRTRCC